MLLSKNDYKNTMEALGDPCRGQSRVLTLLRRHPVISQKELSELLEIRTQSLGELLIKLERNGYIRRIASDTDRRIKNIVLTAEGAEAADRLDKSQLARVRFLSCLSTAEQIQLSGLLDRLIDELKEENGGIHEPGRQKHGKCPYPHQTAEHVCRGADDDLD